MRLCGFIIVFLGFCVGASADQPDATLLLNVGFEDSAQIEAEWSWWSRTDQGRAQRVKDVVQGGKQSIYIVHDGERDWAFSNGDRFSVTPGEGLRVSAWVKVREGHVMLALVGLKEGKTRWWDIGSARQNANDKWEKIEAIVEVPRGCDEVYARFVGFGTTLAWVDDLQLEHHQIERGEPKPKVEGFAQVRVQEKLDRAVVARPTDNGIYVGWRLLPSDLADVGFDVYRQIEGEAYKKINNAPVVKTTDFLDTTAPKHGRVAYRVQTVGDKALGRSVEVDSLDYIRIPLQGTYAFQKIGIADLNGDAQYDYVIKQPGGNVDPYFRYWKPSPETFKLEAYQSTGDLMWQKDLGWAIERGIWYSPYVVYDFDGDGKAEVAVKMGEGDPRDADGRVQSGPEYLAILDGETGKLVTRIDWPSRSLFEHTSSPYNYASRNQLGVAYLDGKTPHLIVERGTYNVIVVVAYEYHKGVLREVWRWDNRTMPRQYSGQGAHFMHAADLDGDGRDEVTIGSVALDDNGESLWSLGLGHPDHHYVGDIDPTRPGLEIYYGIETRQDERNGMCLVDAATGEFLWGHEGSTRHVHSVGMCSDIDARYVGAECYSADTDAQKKAERAFLRTASGEVISTELRWRFGPQTVYWDADPQREILWRRQISDFEGEVHKVHVEGRVILVADILGDWREEVVTSVNGELRVYTTTIPAEDRRPCLMTDPIYRIDVAHASMGYTQVPMLSYDMASQVIHKGAKKVVND